MPPRRPAAPPPRPAGLAAAPAAVAAAIAAKPKAAAAGRSLGDWLWHGLGATVATASAGFATYAVIFSTGQVVPSGNFNLFSPPNGMRVAAARHADPLGSGRADGGAPAPTQTASAADTAARDGVDPTPTGSLGGSSAAQAGQPGSAGGGRRRGPDGPVLPAFTLRDVFDGKALVESRASLSVVKPGSVLDGAGEVLSIEKHGDHWIVLTQNGVIAGQRR